MRSTTAPPSDQQQRMVELLDRMSPLEGYNLTALPDVRFLRSNRALRHVPVLYDPGIVIVCQGRKRGYWGDRSYVYDAQHYLAVSIPVPFTMETDASPQEPLLAIYLHLDIPLAAELLMDIETQRMDAPARPCGMIASPMAPAMAATVARFLEIMAVSEDQPVLGRAMVREIYYRVLQGPQGAGLRAALGAHTPFGRIRRAIQRIHSDYARPITVEQLARDACMSIPTFHAQFKSATETSPMQYVKTVRLHQARLLMFREDMTAASAAAAVGYESPSQFSREFKRLFDRTPTAEVAWMRSSFALPAKPSPSIYVASH
ncbi:AraC family transcriptional regulator [Salinisphaera hydrothermalis]|uniref:AraC family transcriptional regulator n=1 Tax=Salinisphaera hydrothermalis (strain C41B8) TaxID=1304275 RepID=A0A084IHG6_SALHC|nr:AraC family transcriptional regulator [Salinisphaera hydrothermalis]KEZ76150.1 AraC family transcriptional regulator [Salinisphaera hydrothermalis C41B8]